MGQALGPLSGQPPHFVAAARRHQLLVVDLGSVDAVDEGGVPQPRRRAPSQQDVARLDQMIEQDPSPAVPELSGPFGPEEVDQRGGCRILEVLSDAGAQSDAESR
jgi:hypothetical protein